MNVFFQIKKHSTKEWFGESSLRMNGWSSKCEEPQNSCVAYHQMVSIFIFRIKWKISQICYWSWNGFEYENELWVGSNAFALS